MQLWSLDQTWGLKSSSSENVEFKKKNQFKSHDITKLKYINTQWNLQIKLVIEILNPKCNDVATARVHSLCQKTYNENVVEASSVNHWPLVLFLLFCPRIAKLCCPSSVMDLKDLQLSVQETAVQINNPIWKTFIMSITTQSSRSLKNQHQHWRKTLHKSNLWLNILKIQKICKEFARSDLVAIM